MSNEAGRILIVDDDEATRYVRGHLLRRHGYEIHETGRGHEGLALAEDQHPDLILLDVKLPDANGIDICRAIKSRLPQTIVLQTSVPSPALPTGPGHSMAALIPISSNRSSRTN